MVIWRRLSSVRSRALTLVFIALLSLLGSFLPLFSPIAQAQAANGVLDSAKILDRARAWSILNAVIDEAPLLDDTVSDSDVAQCHIFGGSDNDTVFVGPHVTGDTEEHVVVSGGSWDALENNVALTNTALASVGIQGGCRGLLEAMGYTQSDGAMHRPNVVYVGRDARVTQALKKAISSDAFFGKQLGDADPGDAISYAMLYYDLVHVCGWSYRNPFFDQDNPSLSQPENQRNREAKGNGWGGDSTNSHFYTYTYENGKTGFNTYFKGDSRTDDIQVGSKTGFAPSGNNDAVLDCGDNNADTFGAKLADNHRFADDYAALLKPGGNTNPGTCKDRYGNQPAELAACDAGFKNKGTANYCRDTYPPQDQNATLREACNYGAQTATGGADTTTPAPGSETDDGKGNTTTCAIEGIGWILCPILNFMASITDGAYEFIEKFLVVQPLLTSTTGTGNPSNGSEGTYAAWQVMRNFANVVFVIAFLIIIFSQVTGFGINNYGIKKMLPRLIVAAILVNLSYWICAIAVDLSNILGASLKSLFDSIIAQLPPAHSSFSTGKGWLGTVGGLLGGTILVGTALFIGLSALVPALGLALISVLFIFLILIIRQILIILLIVVSPLAFVAYLLPNTEPLFNRWRRLFQTLLLVYPITGLIFGASALASAIIAAGAN